VSFYDNPCYRVASVVLHVSFTREDVKHTVRVRRVVAPNSSSLRVGRMRTIYDGWATHLQEPALPNTLRVDPKFTPRSGSRIRAAQAPGLDLEGHYADRSGSVSHDEDYHIKTVAALHETLSAVGVGSQTVIPPCVQAAIEVVAHSMLWDRTCSDVSFRFLLCEQMRATVPETVIGMAEHPYSCLLQVLDVWEFTFVGQPALGSSTARRLGKAAARRLPRRQRATWMLPWLSWGGP